jgi:hypothetical protein
MPGSQDQGAGVGPRDSQPIGRFFILPNQKVSPLVSITFFLLSFKGICAVSWGRAYPVCNPIKILVDPQSCNDLLKILPGVVLLPQMLPQTKMGLGQIT